MMACEELHLKLSSDLHMHLQTHADIHTNTYAHLHIHTYIHICMYENDHAFIIHTPTHKTINESYSALLMIPVSIPRKMKLNRDKRKLLSESF